MEMEKRNEILEKLALVYKLAEQRASELDEALFDDLPRLNLELAVAAYELKEDIKRKIGDEIYQDKDIIEGTCAEREYSVSAIKSLSNLVIARYLRRQEKEDIADILEEKALAESRQDHVGLFEDRYRNFVKKDGETVLEFITHYTICFKHNDPATGLERVPEKVSEEYKVDKEKPSPLASCLGRYSTEDLIKIRDEISEIAHGYIRSSMAAERELAKRISSNQETDICRLNTDFYTTISRTGTGLIYTFAHVISERREL